VYRNRIALLAGLFVCAAVSAIYADGNDKSRLVDAAKKLVSAINSGDIPTIENMFDGGMQNLLPPDKATAFFGGIVSAGGKLKNVSEPTIADGAGTVRISGERRAWEFKMMLDGNGKISLLQVTPAKAAPVASGDRFGRVAKRLVHAMNGENVSTIESMMDSNMQQKVPPDKATPFFHGLVTTYGKLKEPGTPSVTGSTATLTVPAEHGALDIKFTLDGSDKITELHIASAAGEAAAGTAPAAAQVAAATAVPAPARAQGADRFSKITKKLVDAINGGDIATIEAMFDAAMQQAMPADVSTAFFKGVVTQFGKLKDVGPPAVSGPTAVVRVTAEQGALDFKITLDGNDEISGLYVTPSTATAAGESAEVPRSHTSMRLPFRGEWYVFWGGDNEKVNHHVGVRGQRRAADILIMDADGRSHKGNGQQNEDYYAYGKETLSAGAGKVVTAIDGVPDNVPGSMNPLCVVGNCVIVDQGQNEFSLYAHLQPGSLRVHRGDDVQQGQVIGLCGNSGNTSEPHLHFHVQDKAALQDGAGITPYFTGVKCRRRDATLNDAEYTFLKGDRIVASAAK
jgi:murein DD-endopeptidase MepM/ murein hydrolase activator NlpD